MSNGNDGPEIQAGATTDQQSQPEPLAEARLRIEALEKKLEEAQQQIEVLSQKSPVLRSPAFWAALVTVAVPGATALYGYISRSAEIEIERQKSDAQISLKYLELTKDPEARKRVLRYLKETQSGPLQKWAGGELGVVEKLEEDVVKKAEEAVKNAREAEDLARKAKEDEARAQAAAKKARAAAVRAERRTRRASAEVAKKAEEAQRRLDFERKRRLLAERRAQDAKRFLARARLRMTSLYGGDARARNGPSATQSLRAQVSPERAVAK